MNTKASNPKEAFGSAKVPVGLVPDSAIIEESLAFLEGALKYGRYNWRIAGVRASTYNDAMERHRKRWWNGQDRDPLTRVRELASIRACCAILIDSEICGMLNDDRPPRADLNSLLDQDMENVAHLKELFKDHSPKQFTIADSQPTEAERRAANNGQAVHDAIADQRPEWADRVEHLPLNEAQLTAKTSKHLIRTIVSLKDEGDIRIPPVAERFEAGVEDGFFPVHPDDVPLPSTYEIG